MPSLEFDEAEITALVALLRETIAADRFPLSPRVQALKRVLDKLEPPRRSAEPFPAPKAPTVRSMALRRKSPG